MESISSGFAKNDLADALRNFVSRFHLALARGDFKTAEITLLTLAALLGSNGFNKYQYLISQAETIAHEISESYGASFDRSRYLKEALRKGFLIVLSALMDEPIFKSAFTYREEVEITADESSSRKKKALSSDEVMVMLLDIKQKMINKAYLKEGEKYGKD